MPKQQIRPKEHPQPMRRFAAGCLALVLLISPFVLAAARAAEDESEKEIERYRQMIEDPMANPGYLNVDRGEMLWSEPRGTKNVSLESCDLGEGPGKLEGAYAHLPRYFADTGKVMDLEQRLLWCMETIQGFDTKPLVAKPFSGPGRTSDMEDLVAFIANQSDGMKIRVALATAQEKEMYAIGEALFFRRSSINDFSCSTCHGAEGKRIRLQALPQLDVPGKDAQLTMATWPTYRVSQSALRTMQHRMWDCYRQMRMPAPDYGSEAVTALTLYLTKQAEGGELKVPSIKR